MANLQQNMPGQNGPVPKQNANPVVNEQQNIQDGNIQPAADDQQQNVPAQQPEELMDIKTAYGAVSVPGGAQIIAGWQELGDRLWSLAYVEMGKDYLDAILVSVDKLLTHLSEPIPANTDENRNLLAFRARVISMGYKDIIEKGMKLANELPAKDFEGCDEAAQVAVKMCNLAADESRYFNIGSRNYIRHPGDNEDVKGSDPWIKAIMSGKKTLDNAKAKREQQEEQRRRAEEQRRREEDEREKERIRNEWEIVEREQPRENEQQQENEAQQGAGEEAEIAEPVDENGYIVRWGTFEDRLKKLTNGKLHNADLMFLTNSCQGLKDMLAQNLTKNRAGKYNAGGRDLVRIRSHYNIINESGKKLQETLANADFEGREKVQQLVEKIIDAVAKEVTYLGKGNKKAADHNKDAALNWAGVLVLGKKEDEADKKLEAFLAEAEELNREEEARMQRYAQQNGNGAPQDNIAQQENGQQANEGQAVNEAQQEEQEKERIRNEWEIVEREQPRENEQQPENEAQPVNEQQQVNEEQQENEAQQGAGEEAEIVEPVDENGYIVRWGTFEDRLKKLTNGKLHNADLMFLTNSCQGLKDMLAQNLTK
ncbi:MAG: hypothetical protein IJK38_04335, partial [Oscillospiraceae bacterium]|nr:hypothetical protein [Oscillospiraceae bacterium]